MALLKIRWFYFHISPSYVKFYGALGEEYYFQNIKTGEIVCDFKWVDDE